MGEKSRAPFHLKVMNMILEIVWKHFIEYSPLNDQGSTLFQQVKNHLLESLKSVRSPIIFNEGLDRYLKRPTCSFL